MIKNFNEFLFESLSASDKKDLDTAWDNVMKSDLFNQYTNQKKSDLENFIKTRPQDRLFDILCDELIELGWTEDKQVQAGSLLHEYWKEKAKKEL